MSVQSLWLPVSKKKGLWLPFSQKKKACGCLQAVTLDRNYTA
jgi:hypothetical protein